MGNPFSAAPYAALMGIDQCNRDAIEGSGKILAIAKLLRIDAK